MSGPTETHQVAPEQFEPGQWSREFNRHVVEGDIAASYSGDIIARLDRVRPPFFFRGDLWISVCRSSDIVRAYRLVPIDDAGEDLACYADRGGEGEAARGDPMGFYQGVVVRFSSDWFVLSGPPVCFVPGSVAQPGLFAEM